MTRLLSAPMDRYAAHTDHQARLARSRVWDHRRQRTLPMIQAALAALDCAPAFIVDAGCGPATLTAPLAEAGHVVWGFDWNPLWAAYIQRQHPKARIIHADIEATSPIPDIDLLVVTEILEHLGDPLAFMRQWAPMAKALVVSHPLDEPVDMDDHEHTWSLSWYDFVDWFNLAGAQLRESVTFLNRPFRIVLGWGLRRAA